MVIPGEALHAASHRVRGETRRSPGGGVPRDAGIDRLTHQQRALRPDGAGQPPEKQPADDCGGESHIGGASVPGTTPDREECAGYVTAAGKAPGGHTGSKDGKRSPELPRSARTPERRGVVPHDNGGVPRPDCGKPAEQGGRTCSVGGRLRRGVARHRRAESAMKHHPGARGPSPSNALLSLPQQACRAHPVESRRRRYCVHHPSPRRGRAYLKHAARLGAEQPSRPSPTRLPDGAGASRGALQ
jgi:hypothetical protein